MIIPEERKYVIFDVTELGAIDFTEVLETSANTVRYSVDGLQTFVKYDGAMPPSVAALTTKSQEYTHAEMLSILYGEVWTDPNQIEA